MADYQRVVEFLRDFRSSTVQTVTDEVRNAAADFATLCAEANDRLRQTAVLLQRGLRGEAINLAESSPNLLDLVAALDLPDPEGWAEFCQRNDLPVPPPLQIERAAQLNDAYGQDQPLEQLFSKHRRLALAHAPVISRLDVMRQIAQMDPSPFWDKDLRTFEQARYKELRLSFSGAVRDKDAKAITALSTEVLESPWLEPVPPDLQSAAQDVNDRIRRGQLDTQLADLMTRLRTAFAARSLSDCASMLTQVKELMASNGRAGMPDAFVKEMQPIVTWVQEEKHLRAGREAFEAACESLSQSLNEEAPAARLDAAYREAKRFDQPLSEELEARYDAAVRGRARAMQRKYLMLLAGAAIVLVIVLAGLYTVMQNRLAREWADKIHRAAAARDLPLAQQLVDAQEKNAPKMNGFPAVANAKREVAVLREKADADVAILNAALSALDGALKAAAAASASDSLPDAQRAAFSAADDALARSKAAPDLSWVDPDKRLAATTARVERARDDLRERASRGVVSRADDVAVRADALNIEMKGASLSSADAALAAMEKDLLPLRPFADRGTPAQTAVDAAIKKVAAKRVAVHHARAEFDARSNLASRTATAASAKQALLDFVRQFPDSSSSRDFARAAAAADLYGSVEAWTALSSPWATAPAPAGDKAAEQRLDAVKTFLREYPASPMVPRAATYADYLQQAAEAMALQNTWQAAMNDVLASPLISDLKYLQTTDGVRYYVLGDPAVRARRLNDRVTYTFEALDPENLTRRKAISVAPPKALVSEKPALVPHAQFVQWLAEQLKTVDRSNWDTFGVDLVGRVVAEDKIDPVVRAILLREILQATAKVDGWALGDTYDKVLGDLLRQRLDQVVWYDADKPVPAATIKNLAAIVAEVPKTADVKQRVAAKRAELFRSLQPFFAGDGLLLRDENGHWRVESPVPVLPGAAAWAIVPPAGYVAASGAPTPAAQVAAPPSPTSAASSQPATAPAVVDAPAAAGAPGTPTTAATFVRVAAWKGNSLVVDEAAIRDLPEGTIVLITKPL